MRYSHRPGISLYYLLVSLSMISMLGTGCGHRRSFIGEGSLGPLMAEGPMQAQYVDEEFVEGDVIGQTGCGGSCCGGEVGPSYPQSCGSRDTCHRSGISGLFLPLMSTKLACGSGCGGVYWGEWLNDPPTCCDPCNDCGCWVEPRCCHSGPLSSCLRNMHAKMKHVCHVAVYGYSPKGCQGGFHGPDCGCDSGHIEGPYQDFEEFSEEIAPGVTHLELGPTPGDVTEQVRHKHGRSPHRVVSRRLRR